MFSDVGNIHTGQNQTLREAEVTDTRLDLHQKRPLFLRRKKKKQKEDTPSENNFFIIDQTDNVLSIDIIYSFLANIAQSKPFQERPTNEPEPSLFDTLAEHRLQKLRKRYESARATHAYQQASYTTPGAHIKHIDISNKSCLGLSTLPNKQLYRLIKDLDDLRRQGLTSLKIRKTDSFLQSLISCIEEEKRKLNNQDQL